VPQSVGRRSKLANLSLLIVGFGLGQGSIFLAQTWLVAEGRLHLLAEFGSLYAFAVLGVFIVETASTITLSRHVSAQRARQAKSGELWEILWSTALVRLGLALLIIALALACLPFIPSGFARNYALAVLPCYFLWSISSAGLLDGLNRSGISGLTGIFPYICSAAALPFAAPLDDATAGLILGLAFSLGSALTMATQWVALLAMGYRPQGVRLGRALIAATGREILAVLFTTLPGQAFYRIQILLAGLFLGPTATGLFIYAKQTINAVNMLFVFIRRVEFPHLVEQIAKHNRNPADATFKAFRLGLLISLICAIALVIAGTVGSNLLPPQFEEPLRTIAIFSPLVLTLALSSAYNQGLFAVDMASYAARISLLAATSGAVLSYLLVLWMGTPGFVIAEVGMHLLVGGLAARLLLTKTVSG
jgi:O-antigen/teichoic acid export membrane protein